MRHPGSFRDRRGAGRPRGMGESRQRARPPRSRRQHVLAKRTVHVRASAAVDHRSLAGRTPADVHDRRRSRRRLQRRNLQLPRASSGARLARPSFPDELGHRSPAVRIPRVGRRAALEAPRHVCVRDCRPSQAGALRCPRSLRRKATPMSRITSERACLRIESARGPARCPATSTRRRSLHTSV